SAEGKQRGQRGQRGQKRQKELFAFFALFALFASSSALQKTNSQRNYDEPDSGAAETLRNAEVGQKFPLIYWTGEIETAESWKGAGIKKTARAANKAEGGRNAGLEGVLESRAELNRRKKLLTPRIAGRANVASATRRPWIDANGWQFVRNPAGK